ncbi:MAG: hypothetical protein HRU18_01140 [Pseudoalteromonas sp.]|uniref:hypothetical protein n=1 Tax=Pseudoalteromonas sp. TaxID=53249 RepID=UPI001D8CD9D6|nr:hypothetical protein [Pseudoalteromonas sp.]NRA76784.1 hypothetical protein [Pseudoalteromonas sp.]
MTLRLATINSKIHEFYPWMELVRGEGYFYFIPRKTDRKYLGIFENMELLETTSVYVNKLSHLSLDEWVEEAKKIYVAIINNAEKENTLLPKTKEGSKPKKRDINDDDKDKCSEIIRSYGVSIQDEKEYEMRVVWGSMFFVTDDYSLSLGVLNDIDEALRENTDFKLFSVSVDKGGTTQTIHISFKNM